ncbi:MAG: SMP-30/gluconolactonase/LRE family protein [Candidatus Eisenbacteria bacterium]
MNGEIENLRWVSPLHCPCGLGTHKDRLYTLERLCLTEIDVNSGKILKRYPVPDCDFLNDLAIDRDGTIYISDTSPGSVEGSKIYRFRKGKVEVWKQGRDVYRPNGMFIHDGKLIFGGNPGNGFLKSIDLGTERMEKVAFLGAGVIDGIRPDGKGGYLVSHWEGQIYSVSPAGQVTELIDGIGEFNTADFEYIREKSRLFVPTFLGNRIVCYEMKPE